METEGRQQKEMEEINPLVRSPGNMEILLPKIKKEITLQTGHGKIMMRAEEDIPVRQTTRPRCKLAETRRKSPT